MSDKEFKKLVETYRKNQTLQLKRLTKIHTHIKKKCHQAINLQYFVTDIMAMTEPNCWTEHLITMYEEARNNR